MPFSRSSAAAWTAPPAARRAEVRAEPRGASPEVGSGPGRMYGGAQDVRREPLSLEALFQRHADDVHRLVSRLLGPGANRADIEDMIQQVFLAAHKALGRFRGDSKASTWLYGIATRTVYKELRGRTRHRRMVGALEEVCRALPGPTNSTADLDTRIEFLKAWRCLLELSPKKRVVFILHEIEGMSGPEIAAALDVNEGTVHTRLFHARRELLALMERGTR